MIVSRVPGVELGAKDRGGETQPQIHLSRCYVPQHHIPVRGGAQQLTTAAVPAEVQGER